LQIGECPGADRKQCLCFFDEALIQFPVRVVAKIFLGLEALPYRVPFSERSGKRGAYSVEHCGSASALCSSASDNRLDLVGPGRDRSTVDKANDLHRGLCRGKTLNHDADLPWLK
jgi:hypothetical protein